MRSAALVLGIAGNAACDHAKSGCLLLKALDRVVQVSTTLYY